MRHAKKKKCNEYTGDKKQTTETIFEGAQMFDIANKDFEITVIKMFKEVKETMFKELKISMITMTHQIENINRDGSYFLKKNQMKILKLKSIITKTKVSLARFNNKTELAQERISGPEDKPVEIT